MRKLLFSATSGMTISYMQFELGGSGYCPKCSCQQENRGLISWPGLGLSYNHFSLTGSLWPRSSDTYKQMSQNKR